MIFAAGEGLRLRPLTETLPKALIEVGGVPLLALVARRLAEAGAHRIVVNAHHRADRIADWLDDAALPVPVVLSREDEDSDAPLDTGGGLLRAAPLFEAEAPFLLHNADVLTDLDLAALYDTHLEGEREDGRLATLVVARRDTSRPLFVDARGVYGRAHRAEGWEVVARHPDPGSAIREVGFAGIHVVSPRIFPLLTERGTFSLIDAYLRLVGRGERLAAFDATEATWHDIGTPERLRAAREAWAGRVGGADDRPRVRGRPRGGPA